MSFFFFLRIAKQTIFTILEVFLHKKFLPLLFLFACSCFVGWFSLDCLFVRAKSFRKKINRLEIVLITSLHYTTDVYPYQPAYREFIGTHLFLFVTICDFLSLKIRLF